MAKRIQISQHGTPEVMRLVDFDAADPAPGEVHVKNKAIGINYIDIYIRNGLYPTIFPSGLGMEAAGVVTRLGPDVTELKVGDRVAYAQSSLGAYSELHNVPVDKLVLLPESISFEQAAASLCKGLTVYYLLRQTYVIQPDEIFLFHAAAGGVGLIACQWAKLLGAHLIGTVGSPEKGYLAKNAGAWATINYREENVAAHVYALTKGKKLRVVYDSVGKDTWKTSLDCLQRRGLMVSFGNSSGPVLGVNLAILNQKGSLYVTRPSLNGYITTREALRKASNELFSFIENGAIDVSVPEKQKFALADAQYAHQMLEGRVTQGASILIP